MANRIAIFRDGRIVQYDTPDAILARPADSFVADFVGSDRTLKRLRLVRVAAAMMREPPVVTGEDTIDTALGRMEEHGHVAIVVVGPDGRPRGVVRLDTARAVKGASARGLVAEHQEPLPGVVGVADDLRTAVSEMFTHGVTWLACVDSDGFLQGYVTQQGITRMLGSTSGGP
jgi:osmoprotectant transport system ATP-binding protein